MRELTIAECEIVSGGHTNTCGSACTITELSGITVTGPGGGGGGWYPPLPGGGGGGDGGGGGGGGETPPDDDPCRSFLKTDNPEDGEPDEYKVPPDFDINMLIAIGNTIADIPDIPGLKLVSFKNFVGPGQELDFKSQTSERETYVQEDGTIGTRSIYDAIGNWAYGFVAEIAGIQGAAFLAWLNEQFDGDGVGEDAIDQMHIKAGYEAAKAYKETGELPTERNVYCGGN